MIFIFNWVIFRWILRWTSQLLIFQGLKITNCWIDDHDRFQWYPDQLFITEKFPPTWDGWVVFWGFFEIFLSETQIEDPAASIGFLNHQGIEEIFGSSICCWSKSWRISCDFTLFFYFSKIFSDMKSLNHGGGVGMFEILYVFLKDEIPLSEPWIEVPSLQQWRMAVFDVPPRLTYPEHKVWWRKKGLTLRRGLILYYCFVLQPLIKHHLSTLKISQVRLRKRIHVSLKADRTLVACKKNHLSRGVSSIFALNLFFLPPKSQSWL